MSSRLPPQSGEWIDRSHPVEFTFEGRSFSGFAGDVLTSALWANGVRVMGRSFKYHRPRSVYTMTGYDANVIVATDSHTNVRGDKLLITPGLNAAAVNTWGGLNRDRYRFIGHFSRFLPVGFYYKAFHRPKRLFPFFERQMRKAAGLGRLDFSARSPVSPKDYEFCELAVIGAGPSGLAAALSAADAGVDVVIVDENPFAGGSAGWQRPAEVDALGDLLRRVQAHDNIRLRTGVVAAGWYPDQWIALIDGRRLTKLRTVCTLLATGAIEQPAVFENNDLPGVMLGSAAQRLIRHFAVRPFSRAVVLAGNDDAYAVALDLADAGCDVAAVVDLRAAPSASPHAAAVRQRKIDVRAHSAVVEGLPGANGTLKGVRIAAIAPGGAAEIVACDGLAVSVGWTPNSGVASQAGVRFSYAPVVEQLIPQALPQGVFAAGRVNGIFARDDRIFDGKQAGLAAAKFLGRIVNAAARPAPSGPAPSHSYPIFETAKRKNFVDFDEDIHLADFANAWQEGFDSVELMKRYSTFGMGPSQGKLSNANAVRIVARLNGKSIDETGATTARPFHHPVSIASLAGRRFHPHRHTPLDSWHREHGGVLIHVGPWFRPEYYARAQRSRAELVLEEAVAVRRDVGLIDISTLAKLFVAGPDAAEFLERLYAVKFSAQKPGALRYAIACDEAGVLAEEGIVARLAQDRFYITASTAGGDAFYREMQRWAVLWKMDVTLANATGHLAAINVAGPRARDVLAPLTDIDLSTRSFPLGQVREGTVAGAPATVLRAAFLGEVSFEIHVPAAYARNTWSHVYEAGRSYGIRPFGTEAQRLLRLEKGHLIAGHDTDALTTPFEAGLGAMIKMDKPFFVGKRSLQMLARRTQTRILVGLGFSPEGSGPVPEECQLIIHDDQIVGRTTSVAPASTLGRPIGLAFVRPDLSKPGTTLQVCTAPGRYQAAIVEKLPFYDPENACQK